MINSDYHEGRGGSHGTLASCKMSLKARTGCWGLIIRMDDSGAASLEQIRAFLAGSAPLQFPGSGAKKRKLGPSTR